MDVKFSVALHILVMISESKEEMSSQKLAISVGANSSYIRKVIALLKNVGMIDASQGKVGYKLIKEPKEITLLEVYKATQQIEKVNLFEVHKNSNEECPVGENIEASLNNIFFDIEKQLENKLKSKTLDTVIKELYKQAKMERE